MATTSTRLPNSTEPDDARSKPRLEKRDAPPTAQDIAVEAAAIYPDTFGTPPTPDEIAAEAHAIYMARGGGDGQDMDDWFEAERRLTERRASDRRPGPGGDA